MNITVRTKVFKESLKTIDTIFAKSKLKPKDGLSMLLIAEDDELTIEASHQGLYVKARLHLEKMEEAGRVALNSAALQKIKLSAKDTDLVRVGRRLKFKSRIKGELDIMQSSSIEGLEPEEIDIGFKIETAALLRGVKAIGFTPTNLEKNLSAHVVQEDNNFAIFLNDSMRVGVFRTEVSTENNEKLDIVVPLGFITAMANRADQTKISIGSSASAIRMSTDFLDVYHPLKQEELPDVLAYLQAVYEGELKSEMVFSCQEMVECIRNVSSIASGSLDFQQRIAIKMNAEVDTATLKMTSTIGEAEETFDITSSNTDGDTGQISSKFTQEFLNLIKFGQVTMKLYKDQVVFKSNEDDITLLMAVFEE